VIHAHTPVVSEVMLGVGARWRMFTAAVAVALAAGCGARAGNGGDDVDPIDGPPASDPDARVDAAGAPDAQPCVEGQAQAVGPDGTCYTAHTTERVTWATAQSECQAIGSDLAIIRTEADNDFLTALLGANEAFVGGTDLATEGTFLWRDGTGLTYTNWRINEPNGPNEPNNGGGAYQEDCIVLQGQLAGVWDDRPCAPTELDPPAGMHFYLCAR
jgi:hypothetical protein